MIARALSARSSLDDTVDEQTDGERKEKKKTHDGQMADEKNEQNRKQTEREQNTLILAT